MRDEFYYIHTVYFSIGKGTKHLELFPPNTQRYDERALYEST